MPPEQNPKVYIYQRIVQAKLFIDSHYSGQPGATGLDITWLKITKNVKQE